ncbi:MAG TPA: hypothetical protein VE173_08915 [Longimicrobiales bacterium]|nr:hypothetical protein [Longimicrobiales bacterium]
MPLVATDAEETSPALSPDGRWLVYALDVSGRKEAYVRPFPDAEGGIWQVSTDGGSEPLWSHDGSELFYRTPGGMMAAEVTGSPTFAVGSRTPLLDARMYAANDDAHYYAVSNVDDGFLMLRSVAAAAARADSTRRLVLVRDWLPELRARLGRW